jgi:hypothetical protein
MYSRKSWADKQGFQTGVLGEILTVNGGRITIAEKNRATTYETRKEGIAELQQYLHNNFRRKNVNAVLFGVEGGERIAYAVFVEDNWLRSEEEEEE